MMLCHCGNEIVHVPEHLRDVATWEYQSCASKPVAPTLESNALNRVKLLKCPTCKKQARPYGHNYCAECRKERDKARAEKDKLKRLMLAEIKEAK